jgi:hypothetical protein
MDDGVKYLLLGIVIAALFFVFFMPYHRRRFFPSGGFFYGPYWAHGGRSYTPGVLY